MDFWGFGDDDPIMDAPEPETATVVQTTGDYNTGLPAALWDKIVREEALDLKTLGQLMCTCQFFAAKSDYDNLSIVARAINEHVAQQQPRGRRRIFGRVLRGRLV
eukprot:TRINITY_DN42469_c0_g1_i1.p1 TRINITY_DN42469_c0_g1~~TRINITY_DN42469_c0_g1_i1.p1  ORF type:complete len:105 (+),score=19.29 TRINITY_DN42469_c0_g1_i1:107-421(+)